VDTRGTEGAALVGCFVNNVVLRMEIEPELAIGEMMSRAASEVAAALANHEAPFGRVVAEGAGRRTKLDRPLSNVAMVHNNAPTGVATWGALSVRRQPIPIAAVRYDLALSIGRHGDGLRGNVEFAEHLDPGSAQALADDLRWLIRQAGVDPGRRVGAECASAQWSSPRKEC
jgi:nonribosomal peptide synthetase protein VioM